MSGMSTPSSSSTATLASNRDGDLKSIPADIYHNPQVSASNAVEYIASRAAHSSAIYQYDLAEQVGFGALTKRWSEVPVIELQTRPGAGLSLVGRLSEGTSRDGLKGAAITAYTTPSGLAAMLPFLAHLPPAAPSSRLVLQAPACGVVGEASTLSPSLAALSPTLPLLPTNAVVLISATPQECVDFAALSYRLTLSHVIHLFDQYSSARELGHRLQPAAGQATGALDEALRGSGYSYFEYVGDESAHTVIVQLNGPLALAAKVFANHIPGLGIVVVKVLRPWNEKALKGVLPSTATSVHVIEDAQWPTFNGILYSDVLSSLLESRVHTTTHQHCIVPSQLQHYLSSQDAYLHFLLGLSPPIPRTLIVPASPNCKSLLFVGTSKSPVKELPRVVQRLFLSNKAISARLLDEYDAFTKPGGITSSRILLSQVADAGAPVPLHYAESDFLAILDPGLLKSHSLMKYARPGAAVLITTSWAVDELVANLPIDVLQQIKERKLRIYTIDTKAVASKSVGLEGSLHNVIQTIVAHLAFVRLYLGKAAATESLVRQVAGAFLDEADGIPADTNAQTWSSLKEIDFSKLTTELSQEQSPPLKEIEFNAIEAENADHPTTDSDHPGTWHVAAKHLIFPTVYCPEREPLPADDLYPQDPSLRPEVPDRTYLVTCTVNRRLTPLEYDRNVFHLEFDSRGTGLKYAIGEALGVHGWNDEEEVLDFCAWYGVDPNRLVTLPVPGAEGKLHTRTAFQSLQQQIDLFGRPPKSFYSDLATYATSSVERHALLFIGSAEGSATFKKLSEKDTVHFADVLKMYPSAHPDIQVLCGMIGDIKPRHYSIASSQVVVGDRVDLLVVTVDWVTPSGSPRYGQCTRYLAGLKAGQQVTVSIKPSVMKLPPDNMQPIILAGLGTGAAPFRAFLQYRAWLAQQGHAVGPTYYYFGSRHQSQEYLYGEEIEAFILGGIITRAGLAFSRDGPRKVYIQHKMREDARDLVRMLHEEKGVFYLCGPTWPVPDVYEALVGALIEYQGMGADAAGEYLEGLKEEERYVLEVY